MTSKRTFLIKVVEPTQTIYSTVFASNKEDALVVGRERWSQPDSTIKVIREVHIYKTHCGSCGTVEVL